MPFRFTAYAHLLSVDDHALKEFKADKDGACRAHGLTPQQAAIMKSEDNEKINAEIQVEHEAVGGGKGPPLGGVVFVVSHFDR
jgi:hypothetical protein